jgi:alkanesulfonate monooxygenase SsuD/methylene tetrahydromethanopterin reductase-like flavin-dependent oxidoreductase (luciferase family)
LVTALSGDRVSAAGEFFAFGEVPVVPRPLTRPHPPIVVAATSAATTELAAARGLPVLLGMDLDDDAKHQMITSYRATAARHRRALAGGHIAAVVAQVGDTRAEAQGLLKRRMPSWLGPGLAGYVPVDGRPRPARDPSGYTSRLCRIHPVGTAADCVRIMTATMRGTGIEHLICMVEGAGDPAAVRENIARLGAEVLPRLRDHSSAGGLLFAGCGNEDGGWRWDALVSGVHQRG